MGHIFYVNVYGWIPIPIVLGGVALLLLCIGNNALSPSRSLFLNVLLNFLTRHSVIACHSLFASVIALLAFACVCLVVVGMSGFSEPLLRPDDVLAAGADALASGADCEGGV